MHVTIGVAGKNASEVARRLADDLQFEYNTLNFNKASVVYDNFPFPIITDVTIVLVDDETDRHELYQSFVMTWFVREEHYEVILECAHGIRPSVRGGIVINIPMWLYSTMSTPYLSTLNHDMVKYYATRPCIILTVDYDRCDDCFHGSTEELNRYLDSIRSTI